MKRLLRFAVTMLLLSTSGVDTSQAAGSSGFPSPGRQLLISSQCTNCATHRASRKPAIRTMQGNALRKSKR